MSDLSEFLLARIAEDEAVAREAILTRYGQTGAWVTFDDKEHLSKTTVFAWQNGDKLGQACETEMSWIGRPARDHIARWDPARVLAECAAKRQIVEADARRWTLRKDAPNGLGYGSHPTGLIRVRLDDSNELMTLDEFNQRYCERAEPSEHIRLLALPFADHPDYREEWRV